MLELTSLRKAIDSLSESLKWYHADEGDVPIDILRDSVIQRFEYTYELSWKMMKRWLEINIGSTYVDGISRKELFRFATEHQLIQDPIKWFSYHEARNQTSHVYNEIVAEDVFGVVDDFVKDVEYLYHEIIKHCRYNISISTSHQLFEYFCYILRSSEGFFVKLLRY